MKRFFTISLIIAFALNMQAQSFKLSGTVTDSENNVLPGASVLVKGTFMGTSTNSDGKY